MGIGFRVWSTTPQAATMKIGTSSSPHTGLHCSSKRLVYKLLLRPSEHPEQSPLGTAQERRRRAAGDSGNRPVIFARCRAANRKGLVVSRVICGEVPISIVKLFRRSLKSSCALHMVWPVFPNERL